MGESEGRCYYWIVVELLSVEVFMQGSAGLHHEKRSFPFLRLPADLVKVDTGSSVLQSSQEVCPI